MATATEGTFYGYIMLGKTGMGKSTTGNKLLGSYDSECTTKEYTYETAVTTMSFDGENQKKFFLESQTDSLRSTTKNSHVVTNKTLGISVLDVQGFADSDTCSEEGVYRGNLEIVRSMIHAQAGQKSKFNRVVYFLPYRRIPEKADGNLQEELKVMHHFFGDELFNRMVIVITNSYLEDNEIKITPLKIAHVEKVFLHALQVATKSCLSKCPPIVYISIHDDGTKVREMLSTAEVITKSELDLNVLNDTCINCAVKIQKIETKTGSKIQSVIDPSNGKKIDYKDSLCHPLFIPKHSKIKKFVGGMSILLSLGLTKLTINAPGFFNSEEICIHCKQPPRKPGCYAVNAEFENDSIKVLVDHKNKTEKRSFEH